MGMREGEARERNGDGGRRWRWGVTGRGDERAQKGFFDLELEKGE